MTLPQQPAINLLAQSEGVADGTTVGATDYWSGTAWVEDTTILREAPGTLRVGIASGILRLGDNGDTLTHSGGVVQLLSGGIAGFDFDGSDTTVGVTGQTSTLRGASVTAGEAGGTVTLPANTLDMNAASPLFAFGGFTGSPQSQMRKSDAGTSALYWYNVDATASDGDFRHIHTAGKNFDFQAYYLGAWNQVWSVTTATSDIEFFGDVTIGGVTQTTGVADGTTSGAMLYWNGSAWVEETTIRRSASQTLLVGDDAGTPVVRIAKSEAGTGNIQYYSAGVVRRGWQLDAGEWLNLNRYSTGGVFEATSASFKPDGDVTIGEAGQTLSLPSVTAEIAFGQTNPNVLFGDAVSSPSLQLRAVGTGLSAVYWVKGTTEAADNNYRLLHDASETFALQQFFSATWNNIFSVAAGQSDVTFGGDITVGGVTQTAGVADGTVVGAMPYWSGSAWVEETGIRRTAAGALQADASVTVGGNVLGVAGATLGAAGQTWQINASGTLFPSNHDAEGIGSATQRLLNVYSLNFGTGAAGTQLLIAASGEQVTIGGRWRIDTGDDLTSVAGARLSVGDNGLGNFRSPGLNSIAQFYGEAGNISFSDNITDATSKQAMLSVPHYTSSTEEDFAGVGMLAQNGTNALVLGGFGGLNTATLVQVFAAANATTTTGTEILRGTLSGTGGIWTMPSGSRLGVGLPTLGSFIKSGTTIEAYQNLFAVVGAQFSADATDKPVIYGGLSRTNAEEPLIGLYLYGGSTANGANYGGGHASGNSVTAHDWWASAAVNTTQGTNLMRLGYPSSVAQLTTIAGFRAGFGTGLSTFRTTGGTAVIQAYGQSGIVSVGSNLTDNTSKLGILSVVPYDVDEEDYVAVAGESNSGANLVHVGGGYSGQNSATRVSMWAAATAATLTGTERVRISGPNNRMTTASGFRMIVGAGVGTAVKSNTALSGYGQTIGLLASNVTTDATNKSTSIGLLHYTNAEEPVGLIGGISQNGVSRVDIGGGAAAVNATEQLSLWAAATDTVTTGTELVRLTHNGTGGNLTTVAGSRLGIGTGLGTFVKGTSGLEVIGNSGVALFSDVTTDATSKNASLGTLGYTTAEEPFYGVLLNGLVSENRLLLGGGGNGNAATSIRHYAAANNTTVGGTEIFRGTLSTGGIWTTPASSRLGIGTGLGTFQKSNTGLELIGNDGNALLSDVTTDNTNKSAFISGLQYDSDANPWSWINGLAFTAANEVRIGGGSAGVGVDAATSVQLRAAATVGSTADGLVAEAVSTAFRPGTNKTLGDSSNRWSDFYIDGFIDIQSEPEPTVPGTNQARIWHQTDDGLYYKADDDLVRQIAVPTTFAIELDQVGEFTSGVSIVDSSSTDNTRVTCDLGTADQSFTKYVILPDDWIDGLDATVTLHYVTTSTVGGGENFNFEVEWELISDGTAHDSDGYDTASSVNVVPAASNTDYIVTLTVAAADMDGAPGSGRLVKLRFTLTNEVSDVAFVRVFGIYVGQG